MAADVSDPLVGYRVLGCWVSPGSGNALLRRYALKRLDMNAAIELVREALRDPRVREEIKAILLEGQSSDAANDVGTIEPLIDAREAGKILGMSAPAVRAAAFRKTLPSVHVGRLLRFKRSELTSTLRR